jgi:hypothetical protein
MNNAYLDLQLSDYNFTSAACEKSASRVSFCNTTGPTRDDSCYENSLELTEISSIKKSLDQQETIL